MKVFVCYSFNTNSRTGELLSTMTICAAKSYETCRLSALAILNGTKASFGYVLKKNDGDDLDIYGYGWYSIITNGETDITFVIDEIDLV